MRQTKTILLALMLMLSIESLAQDFSRSVAGIAYGVNINAYIDNVYMTRYEMPNGYKYYVKESFFQKNRRTFLGHPITDMIIQTDQNLKIVKITPRVVFLTHAECNNYYLKLNDITGISSKRKVQLKDKYGPYVKSKAILDDFIFVLVERNKEMALTFEKNEYR